MTKKEQALPLGVFARPNGTFGFRYDITDPDTGKRVGQRREGHFKSPRAAASARTKKVAQIDAGIGIEDEQTVGAHLTRWLEGCADKVRLGALEENTLATYRFHVETMIAPTGDVLDRYRAAVERRNADALAADPDADLLPLSKPSLGAVPLNPRKLTPERITRFLADLRQRGKANGGPASRSYVRGVRLTLAAALEPLVPRALPYNPARKAAVPSGEDPEKVVYSPEQMSEALARFVGDRLFALWLLIALTGMRRSEALALAWDAIDLEAGELEIRRKVIIDDHRRAILKDGTKTKGSRRRIGLPTSVVAALREHRRRQLAERLAFGPGYGDARARVELAFCEPDGSLYHPDRASAQFEQLLRRHDLPLIGLHAFGRHGAVTTAVASGMDTAFVRRLTGHTSDQTLAGYTHLGVAHSRAVAEMLEHAYAQGRDEVEQGTTAH